MKHHHNFDVFFAALRHDGGVAISLPRYEWNMQEYKGEGHKLDL